MIYNRMGVWFPLHQFYCTAYNRDVFNFRKKMKMLRNFLKCGFFQNICNIPIFVNFMCYEYFPKTLFNRLFFISVSIHKPYFYSRRFFYFCAFCARSTHSCKLCFISKIINCHNFNFLPPRSNFWTYRTYIVA